MTNEMTKYKAEHILGLSGAYTYKDLTQAYRAAVKESHPDMGGSAEKMIEVNAAKEYLEDFFENKDEIVSASTTEFNDTTDTAAPANEWDEWYHETGMDMDAPMYNGDDYTEKPQSEWSAAEWSAFNTFRPTQAAISWSEWFDMKCSSYDRPTNTGEAGNIDVSDWSHRDWCFYWFANARKPLTNGQVWTRRPADSFTGPYAERRRARKQDDYQARCRKYREAHGIDWVHTPYGNVKADTFERSGWVGNVGVPFAYARCENYDLWLQLNLEAQREAMALYGAIGTPVAATPGWTGNYTEPAPQASPAASTHYGRDMSEFDNIPNAREMSGFDTAVEKATGKWYRRDDIAGAPWWNNMLNAIVNHFPSRILFWAFAALWSANTMVAGPSGNDYLVMLVLVGLSVINVAYPILSPIRTLLRTITDSSLNSWAKKNGKSVDWNEHTLK